MRWFWQRRDAPADSSYKESDDGTFKVALDNDDHHARYVGLTEDGRQFFLTDPFVPAHGDYPGAEYLALYTFDHDGRFLDAEIDNLGPRESLDADAKASLRSERLSSLGRWRPRRIEVHPFCVEFDDTNFGMIYRPADGEEDMPAVEVQPGNYMAFFEPWDSGEYDT